MTKPLQSLHARCCRHQAIVFDWERVYNFSCVLKPSQRHIKINQTNAQTVYTRPSPEGLGTRLERLAAESAEERLQQVRNEQHKSQYHHTMMISWPALVGRSPTFSGKTSVTHIYTRICSTAEQFQGAQLWDAICVKINAYKIVIYQGGYLWSTVDV